MYNLFLFLSIFSALCVQRIDVTRLLKNFGFGGTKNPCTKIAIFSTIEKKKRIDVLRNCVGKGILNSSSSHFPKERTKNRLVLRPRRHASRRPKRQRGFQQVRARKSEPGRPARRADCGGNQRARRGARKSRGRGAAKAWLGGRRRGSRAATSTTTSSRWFSSATPAWASPTCSPASPRTPSPSTPSPLSASSSPRARSRSHEFCTSPPSSLFPVSC